MQKLIAKYGLASHLAVLAVAPLVLFLFFPPAVGSVVVLWLSLLAVGWVVLEPSMRAGERLHEARRRVGRTIVRDPIVWVLLAVVLYTALLAANSGIEVGYDAEHAEWRLLPPVFPILPGSVGGTGFAPFAVAVALFSVIVGCRHSLGRSARVAFLLIASALAGMLGVTMVALGHLGHLDLAALAEASERLRSFVGMSFALYLLCGLVALAGVFERRWNAMAFLLVFSIGGNAVGAFLFAPVHLTVAAFIAFVVLMVYVLAYSFTLLAASGKFQVFVVLLFSLALGGLLVAALVPEKVVSERIDSVAEWRLFPDGLDVRREVTARVGREAFLKNLWVGTGLATYGYDFRFSAHAEDWALFPRGATAPHLAWWRLLAEQGLVGALVFALPIGFLLFTWIRRLVGWCQDIELPAPACALLPLVLALLVFESIYGCSVLRLDVLVAAGAMMAVSALAFPAIKKAKA